MELTQFLYTWATHFAIPFAISVTVILGLHKGIFQAIDRSTLEKLWKVLIAGIAIAGFMFVAWYLFRTSNYYDTTVKETIYLYETGKNLTITALILAVISKWLGIYLAEFWSVFFVYMIIEATALIQRINFFSTFTSYVLLFVRLPYLAISYFWGRQTPFADYIIKRVVINKVRENGNDALFNALSGKDERGEKYDAGQRGTTNVQQQRAMARSLRNIRVKVRTVNNYRMASVEVLNPRETSARDQLASSLKGLGSTIEITAVNFPDEFVKGPRRLTIKSKLPYEPAIILGDFKSIFDNPFEPENAVRNGGDGWLRIVFRVYKKLFVYLFHLTPPAIMQAIYFRSLRLYTIDESARNKKNFKIQHNIDISLIPEPEGISELKEQAKRVARSKENDIKRAIAIAGFNVTLNDINVGGNMVDYLYTLPEGDSSQRGIDKLSDTIANLLKTSAKPEVSIWNGMLRVSMESGVQIPISFADMLKRRVAGSPVVLDGLLGVDRRNELVYFRLGDAAPHGLVGGKTGSGKTVTITDYMYSIYDAVSPEEVRIVPVDGKGNTFEYNRLDRDADDSGIPYNPKSPNPYMLFQPADGSGDIEYARALVKRVEQVIRDRIDKFKREGYEKISEYNEANPSSKIYFVVLIVDEFSALTDMDNALKASEFATKGMMPSLEYIAKMGRSAGVHMVIANQTLRKSQVPGTLSANLPARIVHGLSEYQETLIALPGTDARPDLQQGRAFYVMQDGPASLVQGNAPYMDTSTREKINNQLWDKFGPTEYLENRQQVLDWFNNRFGETSGEEIQSMREAQVKGIQERERIAKHGIAPQPTFDWTKVILPNLSKVALDGVDNKDNLNLAEKNKLNHSQKKQNTEAMLTNNDENKIYLYWVITYQNGQLLNRFRYDTVISKREADEYIKDAKILYDKWSSEQRLEDGYSESNLKEDGLTVVHGNDFGTMEFT